MKKYLFVLFILISSLGFTQKEDATWVMGYTFKSSGTVDDLNFGVTTSDFSKNVKVFDKKINLLTKFFENNALICNNIGELIISYNGYEVYNRLFQPMKNSDSLNIDEESEFPLEQDYIPQGSLLLPYPEHQNQYVLIHEQSALWYNDKNEIEIGGFQLLYSIIDLNEENGLGKVIERKKLLLKDSLDYGKLTSVRHANGRDWWIIAQEYNTPNYYKIF